MIARVRHVARGAAVVLLCASPFLIHQVAFGAAPSWLVGGLAALQVATIVCILGARIGLSRPVALGFAAALVVAGALLASVLPARVLGLAVAGLCHAVAYVGLLVWFAGSLRDGREPVITAFARRIRRTMPDKVARYTRWVTVAWCGFFAAQLAASALLLAMAPQAAWSAFVNLLNLPLLAAMMLGEFAVRLVRFRHEQRTSLVATLASVRALHGPRPRGVSGGPA